MFGNAVWNAPGTCRGDNECGSKRTDATERDWSRRRESSHSGYPRFDARIWNGVRLETIWGVSAALNSDSPSHAKKRWRARRGSNSPPPGSKKCIPSGASPHPRHRGNDNVLDWLCGRHADESMRTAAYRTTITTSHRNHTIDSDFTTYAAIITPGTPPMANPRAARAL